MLKRQESYGTPAYFGKVEWFDVVRRNSDDMLMQWRVSRVDGKEIVVNGPRGLIHSVDSLRAAVEFIAAQGA
jgi:hypothetical protein